MHTCAAYVSVGLGVFNTERGEQKVPTIQIEYALPDFLPVSVILKTMRDKKILPEVYIWDEHLSEPEVAVLFRIKNPELSVLKSLAAKSASLMAEMVYENGCSEIITTGEANVWRTDGVEDFLREFERVPIAAVIVRESADTSEYDELGTFQFVVASIGRYHPKLDG
ncbi:MAG: hypothetical protein Q7R54_02450 [bacterium]|nr:hypothetical protein [bacterium]